ncbi:hypothetical protein [Pontibacter rugosus]|uniref:Uncharacterized protein n=1 Tax=Pontibacter rugosus TaxID=1745966 RepID=A0ABW3SRY4_9BACT
MRVRCLRLNGLFVTWWRLLFTILCCSPLPSATDPSKVEKRPVKLASDVYEELWQFTTLTSNRMGRFFLSAALLAYGIGEDFLALTVVGLLFLPYHHMLAAGLGAAIREWHLLAQGLVSMLLSTAPIVLAAVSVTLCTEPPIGWQELSAPLLGLAFATVLGLAAGHSATDGERKRRLVRLPSWRKLIGLAVTAHLAVYPVWFGLKLIFGFDDGDKGLARLLSFVTSVSSFTTATGVTFAVMSMRGNGTRCT